MTRAGPGVQNILRTSRRSLDLPDDRRRQRVEIPRVEEFRSMPKLRRAIAPKSPAASPTRSEIDVALAGEIETVPVSADERACRRDEPSFTKWAPKQPMGGPRLERRHDAAPTAGRRNGSWSQSPIDGCAHNSHSGRCREAAPSMSSNCKSVQGPLRTAVRLADDHDGVSRDTVPHPVKFRTHPRPANPDYR